MGWLVGGVWIGVGVLAVVVLAFCLYEISWKARRLRRDLDRLGTLSVRLGVLGEQMATLQRGVAGMSPAGD